jgi:trigger factor
MERAKQDMQQRGMAAGDVNLESAMFEEEANKRVKLGLILGDIIKANSVEASDEEVEAFITEQASSYEDPAEVVNWYAQNPGARFEIRSVLVENKVAEKVKSEAKVTEVAKSFEEVLNRNFG